MLIIKIAVDAPSSAAQGIKEALAQDCEKYGDYVRVLSVEEHKPEQLKMWGGKV